MRNALPRPRASCTPTTSKPSLWNPLSSFRRRVQITPSLLPMATASRRWLSRSAQLSSSMAHGAALLLSDPVTPAVCSGTRLTHLARSCAAAQDMTHWGHHASSSQVRHDIGHLIAGKFRSALEPVAGQLLGSTSPPATRSELTVAARGGIEFRYDRRPFFCACFGRVPELFVLLRLEAQLVQLSSAPAFWIA